VKLTVEQADLAAAVGYAARSLPGRPPIPVLAGLLLDATDDRLRVSAFDYGDLPLRNRAEHAHRLPHASASTLAGGGGGPDGLGNGGIRAC